MARWPGKRRFYSGGVDEPEDRPAQVSSLRPIALAAYGPTALGSIGIGAAMPVLALTARELGASVQLASLVVALLGLSHLVVDLPAGALAARIGERPALILAFAAEALALGGCALAQTLGWLLVAVAVLGATGAVLGLARQAYLTEAVPVRLRARALSTLGGVHRIGVFLGPFVGALVIARWGLQAAYAVGVVASLGGAIVLLLTADIAAGHSSAGRAARASGIERPSVWSVLAAHRKVLATVGVGVLVVSAVRATRPAVLPLWAESIGLDAATTALVFGLSGAVDMLLFYPAGWVMDHWGRVAAVVPSLLVLGAAFLLVPLAGSLWALVAVACLIGLGNGISAGIVMTLGADASPQIGRAQFLGGWRLMADAGNTAGPLAVSAIVAVASLGMASVAIGLLAWAGAGWLRVWVPRYDPVSRATLAGRMGR